jgi:hypothetical protein
MNEQPQGAFRVDLDVDADIPGRLFLFDLDERGRGSPASAASTNGRAGSEATPSTSSPRRRWSTRHGSPRISMELGLGLFFEADPWGP